MPIQVEKEKWILYKHINDFSLIKALALDVKNNCATDISKDSREQMFDRMETLKLYKSRNPSKKPLDSINHRINTLEFFMIGYEWESEKQKKFIFSPLGNLFIKNINDADKLSKIFTAMLFGFQYQHYANNTPSCFNLT